MCDFKPGDEVVCVDDSAGTVSGQENALQKGRVYTVTALHWGGGIFPDGMVAPSGGGFLPHRFRKVERKNDSLSIEAFLTIKPGFEEKDAFPVKKPERV